MKFKRSILVLALTLVLFGSGCTAIRSSCRTGWTNTKNFFSATWEKAKEIDAWIREKLW